MSIYAKDNGTWVPVGQGDGGVGELPGVGGWATLSNVEGFSDTHEYVDEEGLSWKSWTWTTDVPPVVGSDGRSKEMGSITLADDGLVQVIICGAGGAGFNGYNDGGGSGGGGGVIASVIYLMGEERQVIDVGTGSGKSDTPGGGSSVGPIGIGGGNYRVPGWSGSGFYGSSALGTGWGGGSSGPALGINFSDMTGWGPGTTLNWEKGPEEDPVTYGAGGYYDASYAARGWPGEGGMVFITGGGYKFGQNGTVIVRLPLENTTESTELAREITAEEVAAFQASQQEEEESRNQARGLITEDEDQ